MDEFWKMVLQQGGLAATTVAAVLWGRSERAERIEYCKMLFDLGKRSVEADFTVAATISKLTDVINQRRP